jgi:multimeric flavodoxin WrbA
LKISIVNGSPRENGATGKILKEISTYLQRKENVEVSFYNVSQLDIEMCKGCTKCYETGKCVITRDGIGLIVQDIKDSDGIIIGSPTYGSAVTGQLKVFFDRGHFIVEQSLRGKYGFSVATYEIAEGGKALGMIKKFFLVSGASRKGELLVKLDHNSDPFRNPKLKARIHRKIDKFVRAILKSQKRSVWEYVFSDLLLLPLIFKPHFRKHSTKYAGVLNLYKDKGII